MQKIKLKRKEATDYDIRYYIKRCILYLIIFFAVTLICTTVIAFLFYNLNDPSSLSNLCAEVSLYVSFTICTCMLLKGAEDKKVILGFIYGALLLFILFSFSLIFGNGFSKDYKTALRIAMPIYGAIIGLLLKRTKTKSAKRRKRRV